MILYHFDLKRYIYIKTNVSKNSFSIFQNHRTLNPLSSNYMTHKFIQFLLSPKLVNDI